MLSWNSTELRIVMLAAMPANWDISFLSIPNWGKYCKPIGSCEEAARQSGVNVDKVKIITFMITGGISGLLAFFKHPADGDGDFQRGDEYDVQYPDRRFAQRRIHYRRSTSKFRAAILGGFTIAFLAVGMTISNVDTTIQQIDPQGDPDWDRIPHLRQEESRSSNNFIETLVSTLSNKKEKHERLQMACNDFGNCICGRCFAGCADAARQRTAEDKNACRQDRMQWRKRTEGRQPSRSASWISRARRRRSSAWGDYPRRCRVCRRRTDLRYLNEDSAEAQVNTCEAD